MAPQFTAESLTTPHYKQHIVMSARPFLRAQQPNLPVGSLSRCAIRYGRLLVGSNESGMQESYLLGVDASALIDNSSLLIKNYVTTSKHTLDIAWLSDTIFSWAVSSLSESNPEVRIMRYDVENHFSIIQSMNGMHDQCIRELSVNTDGSLVTCGNDGRICLYNSSDDFRPMKLVSETHPIASVKWLYQTQTSMLSYTTEDGRYRLQDTRTPSKQSCIHYFFHRPRLYTHSYLSEYNVIVGFGDGILQALDLRSMKAATPFQDPFVEGIGMLDVNVSHTMITASGYTDLSVWYADDTENIKLWCHSTLGDEKLFSSAEYRLNASFYNDSTIIATDSECNLHVYCL